MTLAPLAAQNDGETKAPAAEAKTADTNAQDAPAKKQAHKTLVDAALAKYERVPGISGNLNSIGSDTLNNLMTFWAEGYRKIYPQVRIQIEGKGSSTAPPALIEGTSQLGPMSRAMKNKEIDDFVKKFGYKPTQIKVAIDALAVFVNKDNPIERLTITQVDSIFSSTRRRGGAEITTWGDLGLTGEMASKPLSLYGRNSASGTYGYFKDVALKGGDYSNSVKEQPGSASVVRSITEDLFGIGYSGIGYQTSGVKTIALAAKDDGKFYGTDSETVLSGKYPLSRFLFIYVNKDPRKDLDPLVSEFLNYVLSADGQTIVEKDGYIPLAAKLTQTQTKLLR
ncbi:MAG: phosphate ABC transporter substrate-binding protein [Planctomycetes bacterium]|nr:phosphate ABC transporter substrate-binding protein [Planctomycetota bacterium]